MKPIMKDAPRQERRRRTLARLEVYLKGGVRSIKPKGSKVSISQGPFTQADTDRIGREISTLKTRLGTV